MSKPFTILIVEDQKENIDILVNTLSDNYELLVATNGERAIKMIENNQVDMVLLDIVLPIVNGYEVCASIKKSETNKDLPIIFLSGQEAIEDKKRGFKLGAVDYITKPFNVEEVKARIHTHLAQTVSKKLVVEENQILHREVSEKSLQLEDAYVKLEYAHLETIERLSRAAEYRDDETGLHVKRVGKISAIIAGKLGLSQEVVYAIEHAAPLHDIGKIGIPEAILLKPGKLNAEEWAIMQSHCMIGKNILKNSSSNIVNMAEIIAYTHHERYDGTGYPLGLTGEQIPIVSRIVAIADVYDALLSERPYKRPYTFDEAVKIILDEEDKHFSKEVVKAFLSSLDDIEQITVKFQIAMT